MTLRKRLVKNCKLARAQAALVALLYVFLCTFGMLTHSHGSETAGAGISHAGQAHRQAASAYANHGKHALTATAHCAFCDWQLHNQAQTVVPFRFPAPHFLAYAVVRFAVPIAPIFPTRSSSRAPPAAS